MDLISINWEGFERFIDDEIPKCVKTVLKLCGFETFISLMEINESCIVKIEECMSKHFPGHITNLQCRHAEYYQSRNNMPFELLPGHKTLIMALPKYVEKYRLEYQKKIIDIQGRYSFILNELIRAAEENQFKTIWNASYSDAVRFFAIYIFLLCGRSCYRMLQSNLPLPSATTISKWNASCFVLEFASFVHFFSIRHQILYCFLPLKYVIYSAMYR